MLSGLLSPNAGWQAVAWPKTPHLVIRFLAHTTSPRRTELIQELANIPAVAFAATIHDMISATSVTSHHTLHACAHPPVCCTLYAVGSPTPPHQHINPLLMCRQVVSQLQAIAWPKTPHRVTRYVAQTTSSRRTKVVQELASIPAVTFAATTHDMISTTCVTSHHTLHACTHPPVFCALYAADRPTPPRRHINPFLMCHQVVSQYTRSLVTDIFKAHQVQHAIVFLVLCHVLRGHWCSSTYPPPPHEQATRTAKESATGTSLPTPGDKRQKVPHRAPKWDYGNKYTATHPHHKAYLPPSSPSKMVRCSAARQNIELSVVMTMRL